MTTGAVRRRMAPPWLDGLNRGSQGHCALHQLTKVWAAAAEFADGAHVRIAEMQAENAEIAQAIPRVQAEIAERRQAVEAAQQRLWPFLTRERVPANRVSGEEPARQIGVFVTNPHDPRYLKVRGEIDVAKRFLSVSEDRLKALQLLRDNNARNIVALQEKVDAEARKRDERHQLINGPTRTPRLARPNPREIALEVPLDVEERIARREARTAAARERGELGPERARASQAAALAKLGIAE